jgi:hypothetical protein
MDSREEKIHKALDQLMSACEFSAESRTEDLLGVLSEATFKLSKTSGIALSDKAIGMVSAMT